MPKQVGQRTAPCREPAPSLLSRPEVTLRVQPTNIMIYPCGLHPLPHRDIQDRLQQSLYYCDTVSGFGPWALIIDSADQTESAMWSVNVEASAFCVVARQVGCRLTGNSWCNPEHASIFGRPSCRGHGKLAITTPIQNRSLAINHMQPSGWPQHWQLLQTPAPPCTITPSTNSVLGAAAPAAAAGGGHEASGTIQALQILWETEINCLAVWVFIRDHFCAFCAKHKYDLVQFCERIHGGFNEKVPPIFLNCASFF